jgi:hypothetical protein
MEMKIHIGTPLYRLWLVPTLKHYLEPMGIEWYPIMTPSERVEFNEDWIHPLHVKELEPGVGVGRKMNDLIDAYEIENNDYYCWMMDDDMYEPGFFDTIRQQTAKIIICSLYRGDTVPMHDGQMKHPARSIVARNINQMRPGHMDVQQYIVKGEILRKYRFEARHPMADGVYAKVLADNHADEIVFLPGLYALFNYFQPGRYTNKQAFPKSTWELPNFVGGIDENSRCLPIL